MPYPKPDQLVIVWARTPAGRTSVPAGDFFDWRQRSTSFQAMHAWSGVSFNITGGDSPEQVAGTRRTPGFLKVEGRKWLHVLQLLSKVVYGYYTVMTCRRVCSATKQDAVYD